MVFDAQLVSTVRSFLSEVMAREGGAAAQPALFTYSGNAIALVHSGAGGFSQHKALFWPMPAPL